MDNFYFLGGIIPGAFFMGMFMEIGLIPMSTEMVVVQLLVLLFQLVCLGMYAYIKIRG